MIMLIPVRSDGISWALPPNQLEVADLMADLNRQAVALAVTTRSTSLP